MQLSINIEMGDESTQEQIRFALVCVGIRASIALNGSGVPAVDAETHLDVFDVPAVWSATIFRSQ